MAASTAGVVSTFLPAPQVEEGVEGRGAALLEEEAISVVNHEKGFDNYINGSNIPYCEGNCKISDWKESFK